MDDRVLPPKQESRYEIGFLFVRDQWEKRGVIKSHGGGSRHFSIVKVGLWEAFPRPGLSCVFIDIDFFSLLTSVMWWYCCYHRHPHFREGDWQHLMV